MMLDSNLIIYASQPEYSNLRQRIADDLFAVSAVSVVEVLGYHQLTSANRADLEASFAAMEILPLTDAVIARAVGLRQARKMSLGDALIAATALEFAHELLTNNLKDFEHIPGLLVSNPLAVEGST